MSGNTLSWKVEGLRELDQNMRELGGNVATKWVNGGLRAGVRLIQLAAKSAVPVDTGQLRDTVRIRRGSRVRSDDVREHFAISGSRVKGGASKVKGQQGAFYAHMQELGTKAHVIRAHANGAKLGRLKIGSSYYTEIHHPGNPATHFMEKSARNTAQASFNAFASYIRAKVARTGPFVPASETE